MFVDKKSVLVTEDKAPILGGGYDRVGFYFSTVGKVRNLKVYVKRLVSDLDLD